MKICHVNFARGFRGGERQTQLLIEALAARGLQQELIARSDSPLHEKLMNLPGLTLHRVSKPYFKNLRIFYKNKPDLIHAHDAKAAQWALLAYWLYKIPYLMTRRISKPSKDVAYTRAVYRNADRVVGLSVAIRNSVQTRIPYLDVDVIPSMYASLPVDQQKLDLLRKKYREYFVVGHIGALVNPHKGQAVLIEAIKFINQNHKSLKFLLLGSGRDEQYLKSLATGVENIEFVGFVEDVGTWINLFDLFVFPSLEEGLGSTLLDIMQHGKPIVASGVGGILDVIQDERNGLLVPPGDSVKLAKAIERMYLDKVLRDRLANAGRESINKYSPVEVAERYHNLYDAVLNSKATA